MIRCVGGRCSQTTQWARSANAGCTSQWRSLSRKANGRTGALGKGNSAADMFEALEARGWSLKQENQEAAHVTEKLVTSTSLTRPESDDEPRTPSFASEASNAAKLDRSGTLPISPLMDPTFYAARNKYRLPKKLPDPETMTDFQKTLARNPYARALATPVRRCKISDTVLPSFFLQDFNTVQDPTTDELWLMPRSLTSKWPTFKEEDITRELDDHEGWDGSGIEEGPLEIIQEASLASNLATKKDRSKKEIEVECTTVARTTNQTESFLQSQPKTNTEKVSLPKSTPSIGVTGYALSSYNLIDNFSNPNQKRVRENGKRARKRKAFSHAAIFWKTGRYLRIPGFVRAASEIQWRPDMADFILELMRRRIVERLILAFKKQRGYLTHYDTKKPSPLKMIGAALYFGEAGKSIDEYNVPDHVPVYDMRELLGSEKIRWLREKAGSKNRSLSLFSHEMVLLRRKNYTVDLEMRLWKLQGYLAEHLPDAGEETGIIAPDNRR